MTSHVLPALEPPKIWGCSVVGILVRIHAIPSVAKEAKTVKAKPCVRETYKIKNFATISLDSSLRIYIWKYNKVLLNRKHVYTVLFQNWW